MSLRDIPLKTEYRSLLDNVISEFYTPVLTQSVMYKRAVGFFSSSALIDLSAGIIGLIKNGGKIQLIASPRLSQEDIAAINDGLRRRDEAARHLAIVYFSTGKAHYETDEKGYDAVGVIEEKRRFSVPLCRESSSCTRRIQVVCTRKTQKARGKMTDDCAG